MVKTYRSEPSSAPPGYRMQPNPSGQWVALSAWRERDIRVRQLEEELAGVTADCLRWHAAYMDLKYPSGPPPFPGSVPDDAHPLETPGADARAEPQK